MLPPVGLFHTIYQQNRRSICCDLWVKEVWLRIDKFCAKHFTKFDTDEFAEIAAGWQRMFTADEARAMLEEESDCDLAMSDLDITAMIATISSWAKIQTFTLALLSWCGTGSMFSTVQSVHSLIVFC